MLIFTAGYRVHRDELQVLHHISPPAFYGPERELKVREFLYETLKLTTSDTTCVSGSIGRRRPKHCRNRPNWVFQGMTPPPSPWALLEVPLLLKKEKRKKRRKKEEMTRDIVQLVECMQNKTNKNCVACSMKQIEHWFFLYVCYFCFVGWLDLFGDHSLLML